MSALIPVTQDYYFSSDVANGALDKSAIGDQFSVRFTEGSIFIPTTAMNVEVSTPSASIWYNTPNMYPDTGSGHKQNNTVQVVTSHPGGAFVNSSIVLPKMLISNISQIQTLMYEQIELDSLQQNALSFVNSSYGFPFSFDQDPSTFRIFISVKSNRFFQLDFTSPTSFGPLIGFGYTAVSSSGGPLDPTKIIAPSPPHFDNVDSYLIHCDLIQTGILVNGVSSQTVAQVAIDVEKAGFQIQYNPAIPPMCQAPHIKGARREYVRCWLTNEKNERVDTDGQNWGFRLRTQYLLPVSHDVSKV
jgi:hypothetical protein